MIVSHDTIIKMKTTPNKPPYTISSYILKKIEEIGKELGSLETSMIPSKKIQLRKENTIKTIQSSLSIEGNSLNLEEVRSLSEGNTIIGPPKDILEVKNALKVYKNLSAWNGLRLESFLKAHEQLMKGLISDNGKWRSGGIGIYKGNEVRHMGPPANRIESLMSNLFEFINNDQDPWLIKACVFHYELEFIHPFSDGNGRMGRLWQQILLMRDTPFFEFIPVEEIIKKHQNEYYDVLGICDAEANSTQFLEFSLDKILIALKTIPKNKNVNLGPMERLQIAKEQFAKRQFSRKEYAEIFKIATATASRDLSTGVKTGKLLKEGDKSTTTYKYR